MEGKECNGYMEGIPFNPKNIEGHELRIGDIILHIQHKHPFTMQSPSWHLTYLLTQLIASFDDFNCSYGHLGKQWFVTVKHHLEDTMDHNISFSQLDKNLNGFSITKNKCQLHSHHSCCRN
jgi:hypothetical protein